MHDNLSQTTINIDPPIPGTEFINAPTRSGDSTSISPTDLPSVKPKAEPKPTLAYYQMQVTLAWNKTRDAIIKLAGLLDEAERNLTPADFKTLRSQVGLRGQTLSRLKRILKDNRLANPEYVPLLPDNLYTLYEIALLDDGNFQAAIVSRVIHPKCTAKGIIAYRKLLEDCQDAAATDYLPSASEPTMVASLVSGNAAASCVSPSATTKPGSSERHQSTEDGHVSTPEAPDACAKKVVVRFTIPTAIFQARQSDLEAVQRLRGELDLLSFVKTTVDWA